MRLAEVDRRPPDHLIPVLVDLPQFQRSGLRFVGIGAPTCSDDQQQHQHEYHGPGHRLVAPVSAAAPTEAATAFGLSTVTE